MEFVFFFLPRKSINFNGEIIALQVSILITICPSYFENKVFFIALTKFGLNGASNCLASNARQSMDLKKGWSWISPWGQNLFPNLLLASFSKNCEKIEKILISLVDDIEMLINYSLLE